MDDQVRLGGQKPAEQSIIESTAGAPRRSGRVRAEPDRLDIHSWKGKTYEEVDVSYMTPYSVAHSYELFLVGEGASLDMT